MKKEEKEVRKQMTKHFEIVHVEPQYPMYVPFMLGEVPD